MTNVGNKRIRVEMDMAFRLSDATGRREVFAVDDEVHSARIARP